MELALPLRAGHFSASAPMIFSKKSALTLVGPDQGALDACGALAQSSGDRAPLAKVAALS
ncbi:hypothetical protein [Paracoccus sp. T5]|uniref:hypothetical protein n=1 Tax=Paracoccus sp. T5 TaxID=3402161 RepID=UPI003ADA2B44